MKICLFHIQVSSFPTFLEVLNLFVVFTGENNTYTAKNHFLIKKKILNLRNYLLKRETDFLNKKNGS
jgi:hypothetical protein